MFNQSYQMKICNSLLVFVLLKPINTHVVHVLILGVYHNSIQSFLPL